MSTKQEEDLLVEKFEAFMKIRPEDVGISNLFTLNESSLLVDMYLKLKKTEDNKNGDVGRSFSKGRKKSDDFEARDDSIA